MIRRFSISTCLAVAACATALSGGLADSAFGQNPLLPVPTESARRASPAPTSSVLVPAELAQPESEQPLATVPAGDLEKSVDGKEIIHQRYANGKVAVQREVAQDDEGNYVNHGSWKMWDIAGKLVAEGQYRFGQRHGTWNRWYAADGAALLKDAPYSHFAAPFISQAEFQYGKLHGKWTIFDAKQNKISEWEYAHGRRHGKWTWWFPTGKMMREVTYRHDAMDGELLQWNAEGDLIVKETYRDGRRVTLKTEHFDDGKTKKAEGLYLLAKIVVSTPDDWWNAQPGSYREEGQDEKHGQWTEWYPTGEKRAEGNYQLDEPHGKFTWWFTNGQQAIEGNYESGKRHGHWTWWHINGQKKTLAEYADGTPSGRWFWWQEDGRLVQKSEHAEAAAAQLQPPANPEQAKRLEADKDESQPY